RAVRRVVEADVFELDVALQTVKVYRVGSVRDFGDRVDNLEHTLRAVRGVGDHVCKLGEEVERAEYHADIADVRLEFNVGHVLVHDLDTAEAPNCLARQTYEQTYEREYRQ